MALKNVQYLYAESLTPEQRSHLNIKVDKGLIAIETRASKLHREPIQLKEGILKYIWSLEKEKEGE